MAHEKWETDAIQRFIKWLSDNGHGQWHVSDEEVVVDEKGRNHDYELTSDGNDLMAVELCRLIESQEELAAGRMWSRVSNGIAARLRELNVVGYTIQAPRYTLPKNEIDNFILAQAEIIEKATRENADREEEFAVSFYKIKRLPDFKDVGLYWIGNGSQIHPAQTAAFQLQQFLPRKNEQLAVNNKRRVLLVVSWMHFLSQAEMVEACTTIDFSNYPNIDQLYFEIPDAITSLVFDRDVQSATTNTPEAGKPILLSPLFVETLSNRLQRKESIAFDIVKHVTKSEKSILWLDAVSRAELVSFGEEFLAMKSQDKLWWVIDNLERDPDPEIIAEGDDAHHKIERGEEVVFIYSVRGRLCWLLDRVICYPQIEKYERVLGILERYASEPNLYVRLQAVVPLTGLAARRFAKQDDGSRFMNDDLAGRVKALAFKMLRENSKYPEILKVLSHVFVYIKAVSVREAATVLDSLMPIADSDSVDNLASLLIYFACYRERHNPELGEFDSATFKDRLSSTLAEGVPRLRARLAAQYAAMLGRNEISAKEGADKLRLALAGDYDSTLNLHVYQASSLIVDESPDRAFHLIQAAVEKEVAFLQMNEREEIWHGREFQQTVEKIRNSLGANALTRLEEKMAEFRHRFRRY